MFSEESLGKIKFKAIQKHVSSRILSLKSVDYFGTSEHYWMVETKKENLNQQNWDGWVFTAVFRLDYSEIRSRNEEAINSIKKHDLLAKGCLLPTLSTSIIFICFWIDLVRVLTTTRNTSPEAGYTRV